MPYLTIILAITSILAQAKNFSNEYIAFQLPPGWECNLEGAEYVCQSTNKDRQKEAIIIMAAKEKGPQDTLPGYQAYLKEKKTYVLPNRKTQVSDPKYTQVKSVNEHRWVDSLHMASEVPGFFTRYLATVKGDLGVAVTFSVAKDHYNSYQEVFEAVIKSMRVFAIQRSKGSTNFALKGQGENILDTPIALEQGLAPQIVQKNKKQSKKNPMAEYLFYGLIALAAGGFIIYKKKKNG